MQARIHAWALRVLAIAACLGLVGAGASASAQSEYAYYDHAALDALVAPIALYPDPLLSQVLMASTYPAEVQDAAAWARARPGLSGDAAVRAAEGWDWDPSVRSLLAFPLVLDTMARYPSWTEQLGDAFRVQPAEVIEAVQRLRRRAYANGSLRSNDYVRVTDVGYAITIDPVTPSVVHVPHYDPHVVYGAWPWPAWPPMYWPRWPVYVIPPGRSQVIVHWGPGIGLSTGFFFGGFYWAHREVRVVNTHVYYYRPRRVIVEHPLPHRVRPRFEHEHAPVWRHDGPQRRPSQEPRERRSAPLLAGPRIDAQPPGPRREVSEPSQRERSQWGRPDGESERTPRRDAAPPVTRFERSPQEAHPERSSPVTRSERSYEAPPRERSLQEVRPERSSRSTPPERRPLSASGADREVRPLPTYRGEERRSAGRPERAAEPRAGRSGDMAPPQRRGN